jgi:Phage tail lysozyme
MPAQMHPATFTVAKQAFDFFTGAQWSREAAAGLIANIEAESAFRADAVGDSGAAIGICQWHTDRQIAFRVQFGFSIRQASYAEQLQFVDFELRNGESGAGNALRRATTPEEAGETVCTRYERPNDPDGAVSRHRGQRARDWFGALTQALAAQANA